MKISEVEESPLFLWMSHSTMMLAGMPRNMLMNCRPRYQMMAAGMSLHCSYTVHSATMKVESIVLVSCTLRARASKSCFINADFSCSSWAIRSLLSVTSFAKKKENK
ncbi:hypothetical protein EYF80_008485 [Liparis tanakae]|uniref:Uncharacterized protein n=1 Tax=Liparis tanakae TaxID=230148 RepID=A0A4Z2ITK2_9TELE|nr:hypothetical protein EYF80_008485 [Liparis tanakae]